MRDVAFSCDDNGAAFLRVAVWSLLKHYAGEEPIRINVLVGYGGHSEENRRLLDDVVGGFGNASVRYVDVEGAVAPYRDLILHRENSRWNVFTWTPVFEPELLGDVTGNLVHFDIDVLFNADISPLFELDLGDRLFAAVYEYGKVKGKVESVIWDRGILPESVERYFNTGVLVMNVAKCREERTAERIVEWYRDHYAVADRIEQDAYNALFWDRVAPLPVAWNFHDRNMKGYAKWNLEDRYWLGNPPLECLDAALAPKILHFWGPKKPWKKSHRPYRRLYHAAMRAVGLTPPGEQILAPYYNLANRLVRWRISWRRGAFDREWRRKRVIAAVKHALFAPIEWLGIALGFAVIAPMPHRAMLAVCDLASVVYWLFDFRGRRTARKNLSIVFGGRQVRGEGAIVRRAYRNMARTVGHAFWTCIRARRRVEAVGEMSGEAKAFLAANRPAITVSAHLGCWEILSQLAFLQGHSMMSVAKDIGTGGMTRLLMFARRSIGQEIVRAEGAFKPLMQGLRDGKSLGLLVDQSVSPRKGGIWIRFFGRPVPVSAAPAFFSAKSKAPIGVAWSRPLTDGRYRCDVLHTYTPAEARDVWALTQSIARDLERAIRRHPSAWVLNYDYFARTPYASELEALERREEAAR